MGSNDIARSRAFYDPVLATLGLSLQAAYKSAFAYARAKSTYPWIYVMRPFDRLPATWGNGTHLALMADSEAAMRAFHETALANGGRDEGAPGLRAHYAPDYYAAYVRDPDGNKLQAVYYGEGRIMAAGQQGVSHVTLGTNDLERARRFYDGLLAVLDIGRLYDDGDQGTAYARPGSQKPSVSTRRPYDGRPATWGNGSHVAFLAPTRAAVDAFHAEALALGGLDEGAPGLRPQYSETYYGAYVRDPDGNKLQAVCYEPE